MKNEVKILTILLFILVTISSVVLAYRQKKISRLQNCPSKNFNTITIDTHKNVSRVVLLGDSRVAQWKIPKLGAQFAVMNLGIGGLTSGELKCILERTSINHKIDWYILSIGINDLVAASMLPQDKRIVTEENLVRNLRSILTRLTSKGSRVILITIAPPLDQGITKKLIWGTGIDAATDKISNIMIKDFSSKVSVFDIKRVFYDSKKARWKTEYSIDALHWNQMAYSTLNNEMAKLLAK